MAESQNPRVDDELIDNTADELDANIFWDISSCSLVKKATIPIENQACSLENLLGEENKVSCCIMPNGESVVCCNYEGAVYILNKDFTVKQVLRITGATQHQPHQVAMLFRFLPQNASKSSP